jgi:hypothetical protein
MYTYTRPDQVKESGSSFTGYMVDETQMIKSFDYASIYRSKQFNEAMKYFDNDDTMTRNILLSVNEADQNVVMTSLANKLYNHITDKVDEIDFGTIPNSKGDITKIDNFDNLLDCVNIISDILQQNHQDTSAVEVVSLAIQNMIDRTDMFEKAYKLNVEMPIIIYNTIALSIVSSISYLISSCIEFVKLPEDKGFDIAMDRASALKVKEAVLFADLKKFNKMCGDGSFDKAMDFVMKQNANNFTGAGMFTIGASSVVVALGILLIIIPLIRELIFFFYYSKAKASEYFDAQSSLLLINAYNIENNLTRDPKKKKQIADKQRKIADTFKKLSNSLKVNLKTGEKKAVDETEKLDKQKLKHGDVLDRIPDSSNSVLF